jgi:hypothetical protein
MPIPDDAHTTIAHAARPLDPERRGAFVTAVLAALESCAEVGPGTVSRTIKALQREHWDPPQIDNRPAHLDRSKLRSGQLL